MLDKLSDIAEGVVIMGGDLNLTLDPTLDSTTGRLAVSYPKLSCLKRKLHALQLIDVWHVLHPEGHDYLYYSTPHNSSSRLDYLLVSHQVLDWTSCYFDTAIWSDHSPIFLEFTLTHLVCRQ